VIPFGGVTVSAAARHGGTPAAGSGQQDSEHEEVRVEQELNPAAPQLTITLASPDMIMSESRGEVTKPETINYRSYKPEKDGLFCEKIFGPVKDWECHCGKYKGSALQGHRLRPLRCRDHQEGRAPRAHGTHHAGRARGAHLVLPQPALQDRLLPGHDGQEPRKVIYYESNVCVKPGLSKWKIGQLVTDNEIEAYLNEHPNNRELAEDDPDRFIWSIGAEAIKTLLANTDVDLVSHQLRNQVKNETSVQRKNEALKRLNVVEAFRSANCPPDPQQARVDDRGGRARDPARTAPAGALDGGRFATSDLNDLYRRVIIRNNRLKRLVEIKAPEVILRNEKRMLQEAVDSLFDNGRRKSRP
jgi:DNA-directed RNA polymerase subunit beta'